MPNDDEERSRSQPRGDALQSKDPWKGQSSSHRGPGTHDIATPRDMERDSSTGWEKYADNGTTRRSPSPHQERDRRRRKIEDAAPPSGPPPNGPDLARLMVDGFANQSKESDKIHSTIKHLRSDMSQGFAAQDKKIAVVEQALQGHTSQLEELFKRLTVVEGSSSKVQQVSEEVAKRLDMAENSAPLPLDEREFARKTDPSVVRVSSEANKWTFSPEEVKKLAAPLLEIAGIDPSLLVVHGASPSKAFVCHFQGTSETAADRAFRFLRAIKKGDGSRIQIMGNDIEDAQFQAYWEHDKKSKMQRTEFLTKKLGQIISGSLPMGARIHTNRAEGIIMVGWDDVARVRVISKGEVELKWADIIPENVLKNLDKPRIAQDFLDLAKPRKASSWS